VQPTSQLSVEIPGHTIAGQVWGEERAGPTVLALHGWLDSSASFARLAPLLRDARIIAVDLPGHGASSHKAPGSSYHFVDAVCDAVAIMDALGLERTILLGHSMGAGISSLIAGLLPSRVGAACLVEGLGPLTDEPQGAPTRLAESLKQQHKHQKDRRRVFPTLDDAASRLELAQQVSPASAAILAARATEPVDGGLRWRADPRLRIPSRVRFTEAHVHAFLSAIEAPVRLIQATQGFPFDEETMRARVALVRQLEIVKVPGHHHVHLDSPEHVAPVLQDLIDAM
jgi:pimeloyl-ACP methyl ester carboxylesterase